MSVEERRAIARCSPQEGRFSRVALSIESRPAGGGYFDLVINVGEGLLSLGPSYDHVRSE